MAAFNDPPDITAATCREGAAHHDGLAIESTQKMRVKASRAHIVR